MSCGRRPREICGLSRHSFPALSVRHLAESYFSSLSGRLAAIL